MFELHLSRKDMDNMIRRINRRLKTFEKHGLQNADMYNRILITAKRGGYKIRTTSTGFEILRSKENYEKPANFLQEADQIGGLQTWINRRKKKFGETYKQALDKIKVEVIAAEFISDFISMVGGSPLEKDIVGGRPEEDDTGALINPQEKSIADEYVYVDKLIDALNRENGEDISNLSYDELTGIFYHIETVWDRIAPEFEDPFALKK